MNSYVRINTMRQKNSFTLVEIMIVVAIVVVLVILAVPNFLRSRITVNENAVIACLRTINNALQLYYQSNKTYPASLADLTEPVSIPPYLNSTLAGGKRHGYEFIYNFVDSEHFNLNANPLSVGRTGVRYFYTDETGVIRANSNQQAGPNDQQIS